MQDCELRFQGGEGEGTVGVSHLTLVAWPSASGGHRCRGIPGRALEGSCHSKLGGANLTGGGQKQSPRHNHRA